VQIQRLRHESGGRLASCPTFADLSAATSRRTDFPTQDRAADTRRMNAYIESPVLEMPEQYV
jgi:lauroyl/myristoyl acyltransferase